MERHPAAGAADVEEEEGDFSDDMRKGQWGVE